MSQEIKQESRVFKYLKITGLWIAAILIAYGIFKLQKVTGPTNPYKGSYQYTQSDYHFELLRSAENLSDARVEIKAPEKSTGKLYYQRYHSDEPWGAVNLQYSNGVLFGYIPKQPAAGKVEYYLVINLPNRLVRVPEAQNVVMRFKGHVPAWLLVPHIILMVLSILLVIKSFLDTLCSLPSQTRNFTLGTYSMILGGLVFGPIVQKLAFGAYWTGWPFGGDWTDSKVGFMVAILLIANYLIWNKRTAKATRVIKAAIIVATLAMLVIYVIPHSFRGSSLDYKSGIVKTGSVPKD